MTPRRRPSAPARSRWRDPLLTLGWLVLVWNLLWGHFTWGNVIGGLVVALIVLVLFPLPPVTFAGRVRLVALLWLVVRFLFDVTLASVQVARLALEPDTMPHGAIIAVPLRVRTDLNLTLTAELVTLVPGSLIVTVDRYTGTLYVHVLNVRDDRDLEKARRAVRSQEARLVRAIGSAAEVRQLTASPGVSADREENR